MKHIVKYSQYNESWIGDKFHSLIDAISLKLNSNYANKIKKKIDSNTPEKNEKLLKLVVSELKKFKRPEGVSDEEFKRRHISKHQHDHLDAILVGIFGVTSYLHHGGFNMWVYMWIFLCLMKYKKVIKSYNDNEENTYRDIIEYIKTSLKTNS